MTYGYARVSTSTQNLERQIRNILREDPDAKIITEKYTGKVQNRPEWSKLFAKLESGDTLICDSVSRMSRNEDEGFREYMELFNRGVEIKFLVEPHISTAVFRRALDTSVPLTNTAVDCILSGINAYLQSIAEEQIRLAFGQAEKERKDLSKRTSEGLETAKKNGKQVGLVRGTKLTTKKSIKAKEIIRKHNKSFGGTLTDKETASLAGISINSLYKYKAEMRKDGN